MIRVKIFYEDIQTEVVDMFIEKWETEIFPQICVKCHLHDLNPAQQFQAQLALFLALQLGTFK